MNDSDDVLSPVRTILHGADGRDWRAIRDAFTDPVTIDYGSPESLAPDVVVDRWRQALGALDGTTHRLLDPEVAIDADTATVTSAFSADHWLAMGDSTSRWRLQGRYEFRLQRSDGAWRVAHMRMVPGASTGDTDLMRRAAEWARGLDARRARNRATVHAFFARLEAFDIEGFTALFDPAAVQRMPYAPNGFPHELRGRDAIRAQYAGIADHFVSMAFVDREILDTTDPDRFVATFRGSIRLRAGGRYDNLYVSLFTIRDGRILEVVEHFDPRVLQAAFGGDASDAAAAAPEGTR